VAHNYAVQLNCFDSRDKKMCIGICLSK